VIAGSATTITAVGTDVIGGPGVQSIDLAQTGGVPTILRLIPVDTTAFTGTWLWYPEQRSGSEYDLPTWWDPTTGTTTATDGAVVTMSGGVPTWGAATGSDERPWLADALAEDMTQSDALWMRCFPTAVSMDGSYDGVWEITNAGTGTGTLPATPDGIDVRMKFYLHAPYSDAELDPGTAWPYQRYRELVTQTKAAATGGDLTEWAVLHSDSTFSGQLTDGAAIWFYESTLTGDPGEGPGLFVDDGGQLVGVPVIARVTHDTATETVTFWRWLPYDSGAPGVVQTADDGYWWEPVGSRTDAQYASMDPNGVETWKIGVQNRMDVAWLTMHEYGGSKILDIQPSDIASAGIGATSFTDGVGNTISTTSGDIGFGAGAVRPHAESHESGGSDALSLDASQITSGVFPPARLGTGTPTVHTFLNGLGEWTYDVPVFVPVKNTTASTIAKGVPVYATGTVGSTSTIEIAPADANVTAAMPAIGLTETSLTANATGFVVVVGTLRGVDTNAYSINQPLYVSTTAGQLTGTKPTGTSDAVQMIGLVTRVNTNNGEILVLAKGADEVPNAIDAGKITSGTLATARLGSGTANSGSFLRGDQTWQSIAGGTERPPSLIVAGQYVATSAASTGNAGVTSNRLFYLPIYITRTTSFDRIGITHAATPAGAGSVVRLGIYNSTNDLPSTLVLDAGTVDLTTAAAYKEVTISPAQSLSVGVYWLAAVAQITSGSPTFVTGTPIMPVPSNNNTFAGAKFEASVTSTLPATATPGAANTTQPPVIFLRAVP
jgi:hypothetical protein